MKTTTDPYNPPEALTEALREALSRTAEDVSETLWLKLAEEPILRDLVKRLLGDLWMVCESPSHEGDAPAELYVTFSGGDGFDFFGGWSLTPEKLVDLVEQHAGSGQADFFKRLADVAAKRFAPTSK